MEEGGSKAEFPLTHQLLMIGVGGLAFALLNVISRSLGTLQRNNLCKCRMAFRYNHRLHASILKSCVFLHAPF